MKNLSDADLDRKVAVEKMELASNDLEHVLFLGELHQIVIGQ